MKFCPLCHQEIHGHVVVEDAVRELVKRAGGSFVSLNYYGAYRATLCYQDSRGVYRTPTSQIEPEITTQTQADAAHIANFTKALR